MMKKITKKAMKVLTASLACQDLPDESKEHVVEACKRCLRQTSIADPGEVQDCLLRAVEELANMYLEAPRRRCSSSLSSAWRTCQESVVAMMMRPGDPELRSQLLKP
jgi:hypothetical protein